MSILGDKLYIDSGVLVDNELRNTFKAHYEPKLNIYIIRLPDYAIVVTHREEGLKNAWYFQVTELRTKICLCTYGHPDPIRMLDRLSLFYNILQYYQPIDKIKKQIKNRMMGFMDLEITWHDHEYLS